MFAMVLRRPRRFPILPAAPTARHDRVGLWGVSGGAALPDRLRYSLGVHIARCFLARVRLSSARTLYNFRLCPRPSALAMCEASTWSHFLQIWLPTAAEDPRRLLEDL